MQMRIRRKNLSNKQTNALQSPAVKGTNWAPIPNEKRGRGRLFVGKWEVDRLSIGEGGNYLVEVLETFISEGD